MLQVVLRNRYLFIGTMLVVWGLIFLIPKMGDHYRMERKLTNSILKENEREKSSEVVSNNQYNKEEMTTDYDFAGEFRQGDKCIDTLDGKEESKIGLWKCHGEGRNQFFFLLKKSQNIRNNQLCLKGPTDLKSSGPVLLHTCLAEERQAWIYERENIQLSGSSLCIESKNNDIILDECNGSESQKWKLKTPPGM